MTKRQTPNQDHILTERAMITRISIVSIAGNSVLSAFKLFAGIFGHSSAMISDSVHSFSDVFTTLVAYVGVRMSNKAPDKDHQYGHEKYECLASMILAVLLCLTGLEIGKSGVHTLLAGHYETAIKTPGVIALIAAVISVLTKEAMFWYTRHYARILKSDAFMADAWHHRSDALSSIGAIIGIGGAMLGYHVLEPIASLGICLCIFKVSYDILCDALKNILDTACTEEYEHQIAACILAHEGVLNLDVLRTRLFGNKVYIDAEISVDGNLSLYDAHAIAEEIHDHVEQNFENVKHIMIHLNPANPDFK